jgi:XTP/dITP diphosphohydrolase
MQAMTHAIGKILVASHNSGKVREIGALLAPLGFTVVAASGLGLAEPDETEDTFEGNAILKARAGAQATGLPALADDSGLVVTALDGAPGIYSARWAGPNKDFAMAMQAVWTALEGKGATDLSAHFVCVLALAQPDGAVSTFRGEVAGALTWPPRGDNGFGYDPIFIPDGHALTFGEMDPDAKHAMSHRARAFEKLVAQLAGRLG